MVRLPDSGTAVGLRALPGNSLECAQPVPPPAQTSRKSALPSPWSRPMVRRGEAIAEENWSALVIAFPPPFRFAKSSESRPNWLRFRAVFRCWKEDPFRFCPRQWVCEGRSCRDNSKSNSNRSPWSLRAYSRLMLTLAWVLLKYAWVRVAASALRYIPTLLELSRTESAVAIGVTATSRQSKRLTIQYFVKTRVISFPWSRTTLV